MSGYLNTPYGPPGFPHAFQSSTAPSFHDRDRNRAHHVAASVVGVPSGWTPEPAPGPALGRTSLPFESVDDDTVDYRDYNYPFEPSVMRAAQFQQAQPQTLYERLPSNIGNAAATPVRMVRTAKTTGFNAYAQSPQMGAAAGMSILSHT